MAVHTPVNREGCALPADLDPGVTRLSVAGEASATVVPTLIAMPRFRTLSIVTVLTSLLCLGGPLNVEAQQITSPYRFLTTDQGFGMKVGYGGFGSSSVGLQPGSGMIVDFFYGIDLGGAWGFDLGSSMHRSKRDVIDPTREEGERVIGTADARFTEVSARLKFGLTGDRTFHGINPFVLVGVGVGLDFAGASTVEDQLQAGDEFSVGTLFVPSLAGGVRYFVTDRIEVRTEFGLKLWGISPPENFRLETRLGPTIPEKEWVNFTFVTLGLAYRFGG